LFVSAGKVFFGDLTRNPPASLNGLRTKERSSRETFFRREKVLHQDKVGHQEMLGPMRDAL